MKKIIYFLIFGLCFVLMNSIASAALIDLSSFMADDGVLESGGVITFTEDTNYSAIYFYKDDFFVENNASVLSFVYEFQLGAFDYDDYFTFELDYTTELEVDLSGLGHFEIDLSSYQGTEISLAWGLIWDSDDDAGTIATVSNIDLSTTAPIPIPGTFILLCTSLIGLFGLKKFF